MRRAPRFFHSYFFSCKRADDEWEGAIGGEEEEGGRHSWHIPAHGHLTISIQKKKRWNLGSSYLS